MGRDTSGGSCEKERVNRFLILNVLSGLADDGDDDDDGNVIYTYSRSPSDSRPLPIVSLTLHLVSLHYVYIYSAREKSERVIIRYIIAS